MQAPEDERNLFSDAAIANLAAFFTALRRIHERAALLGELPEFAEIEEGEGPPATEQVVH